ncbi:hypothetical protein MTR67_048498 [Solanum verrucosum]|uniref:Uncharacterized protein n=1 Tax=Solanum verrucosum TaxID=315347 RepID=A0AAF0ZZA8_SOLVR|nr:hypothetical protein MTR67_048498 [Solanum verrucosum]
MIESLQVVMISFLGMHSSLCILRSNVVLLDHPPNLNIKPLPMQLLNSLGYNHCYLNSAYLSTLLLCFGVIILVLPIYPLILIFMLAPNMSKSIITSSTTKLLTRISLSSFFQPKINLMMFSQSLFPRPDFNFSAPS